MPRPKSCVRLSSAWRIASTSSWHPWFDHDLFASKNKTRNKEKRGRQHKTTPKHQCYSSLGFAKLITVPPWNPRIMEDLQIMASHLLSMRDRHPSCSTECWHIYEPTRPQTGDAWRTAINTISGSLCSSEALLWQRGANPSTLNVILAEPPFQQVGLRWRCTFRAKNKNTILKLWSKPGPNFLIELLAMSVLVPIMLGDLWEFGDSDCKLQRLPAVSNRCHNKLSMASWHESEATHSIIFIHKHYFLVQYCNGYVHMYVTFQKLRLWSLLWVNDRILDPMLRPNQLRLVNPLKTVAVRMILEGPGWSKVLNSKTTPWASRRISDVWDSPRSSSEAYFNERPSIPQRQNSRLALMCGKQHSQRVLGGIA